MAMQYKLGRDDCPTAWSHVAIAVMMSAGWAHVQVPARGAERASNDPYYIVLCTDVSGSMNESDPLYRDRRGKLTTLRDDAQLTFLTLLGECPIESFVGACKFSDRITGGLPGGESETVATEAALLPWREIGADWESLREQLSTRKSDAGGTRIEAALKWGHRRISLARQRSNTMGHGIIILLSDGDPDRASSELRSGAILNTARELAATDIRVYSIIVNKASYRPGRSSSRLSDREAAAEELMTQVANTTRGEAHRITATSSLLDIFLDVFSIVPTSPPLVNPTTFDVSRYHRTVVLIGPMSSTIRIEPATSRANGQAYLLPVADGMDGTSGIDRRVIPLALWNIIILRRPADAEQVDRYWSGAWRPALGAADARYDGRVYLITDFLLRLAVEPMSTCWTNERIRVAAHLVERPRELGEQAGAASRLHGGSLSLSFQVSRGRTAVPLTVGADHWDDARQVCRSVPFQADDHGSYVVVCDCFDTSENRKIPLGEFFTDLSVEPSPYSWVLRRATDGQIVYPKDDTVPLDAAAVKGGERVYAELRHQGRGMMPELNAQLHVTNLTPSQYPFRVDSGRRITQPFQLPRGDIHLMAQAQLRLTGDGRTRELSLPGDFFYNRGDMGLECVFSDSRAALWVGEYHRQTLRVSAFPVFSEAGDAVARLFPRELSRPVMTFLDAEGGGPVAVPVRCVLDGVTRDRQQNALRLTATYRLQLTEPVPACRRCEIDSGPILTGLGTGRRQYEVVDPAQNGILSYRVCQSGDDSNAGGVAETLASNEPVVFRVERGANQGVGDVLFEFREQGAGEDSNQAAAIVPLMGTSRVSEIDYSLAEKLRKDTNYDVYVYASVRPEGASQDLSLRLRGGSFRAVERHLELEQLVVGPATAEDLSCYALETLAIPLRARFTGYRPGAPEHSRLIADFKDSCRLTAVSDSNEQSDVSASIQWSKAQAVNPGGFQLAYELEGQALFTAGAMGRHRMEFRGEIEVPSDEGKLRNVCTANCRLFVKEPWFTLKVREITPRGEHLVFDTERLAFCGKSIEPIRNSYATQLRVALDFSGAVRSSPDRLFKVGVIVKHRSSSGIHAEDVFAKELEFAGGQETAEFAVDDPPLTQTGGYFLALSAVGSEDRRVQFTTPLLVTIAEMDSPQEIIPARGFLTDTVRQWPFSYRVPIQSSWSFKPIDLRFEFQFAGMKDTWLEGVASPSEDGSHLIVRGPDYLPACDGIAVGPMKFRLRYMGADRVTWESVSPIQIVKPCLDGVDVFWTKGREEHIANEATVRLRPPFTLRARPRFRTAAELQGWWSKRDSSIWVARAVGRSDAGSCTSSEYLGRLTQLAAVEGNENGVVRMFRSRTVQDEQNGIEVMRQGPSGGRFWGLPRLTHRDVYYILASASYEEKPTVAAAADAEAAAPNRVITEWTSSRAITVERPWEVPYMWWLLAGAVASCALAQVTKSRWVPSPSRLGLSVHVRGDAMIRPARQNSTVADLDYETSWFEEKQMYAEYLSSRHPRWSDPLVRSAAWATVALSRLFRLRRRLWISVRPEVDPSATHVQTALMCVWTGVGRRHGAMWSSHGGQIALPDPGETAELGLSLSYRVDANEMTAPVAVCIKRA